MRKCLTFVAASALAGASAPALAQMTMPADKPVCPAAQPPLPAELASWNRPTSSTAAKDVAGAAAVGLAIGQATDMVLSPTPLVTYMLRPARPGGSVSSGGMASFKVTKAGIYRVAIDSAAWLDVVADGKSLESVNHGHGPDCSTVRKMVDFKLEPGTYMLQIVGSGAPKIRVLVTTTPAA